VSFVSLSWVGVRNLGESGIVRIAPATEKLRTAEVSWWIVHGGQ
jgi:hypothetical protein